MAARAPAHPHGGHPPTVEGRLRPALALRRNVVEFAQRSWQEHGDVVRMVVGPRGLDREMWWLHHPDAAAKVLSGASWRSFAKRGQVYDEIATWLGRGLLAAEGEDWTRQRRVLQPVFTHAAVHDYTDLMVEEMESVISGWPVAAAPTPVDLGERMQHLTLRVVLRALFGESASDATQRVRRSFPALSAAIISRGLTPLRLPAAIPTAGVRRARAARTDLVDLVDAMVEARRSGRTTGGDDLLGHLLTARDGERLLSDGEVRAQALVFLLAGHETTSSALTYTLHLLGRRPDVQDRLRTEVHDVLGERRPSATDAASLPETTAALKEAMRLYPSAPVLGRLAVEDDEIMGYPVAAGTSVVVAPWTIHRHPDFWVDPLIYDPSRFTTNGPRPQPAHRYAWMPFGGGPRACIGQHFSMVESVLALALILRSHRVAPTRSTDADHLPVGAHLTLVPTTPVLATLSRLP